MDWIFPPHLTCTFCPYKLLGGRSSAMYMPETQGIKIWILPVATALARHRSVAITCPTGVCEVAVGGVWSGGVWPVQVLRCRRDQRGSRNTRRRTRQLPISLHPGRPSHRSSAQLNSSSSHDNPSHNNTHRTAHRRPLLLAVAVSPSPQSWLSVPPAPSRTDPT